MKLTWLTDLHLDCVDLSYIENFFKNLNTDSILITGDIAKGNSFYKHLKRIQSITDATIYFVLGNHDLYKSGFREAERKALTIDNDKIIYLTKSEPIKLNETTALVGHDGWYDFKLGAGKNTNIKVNDFKRIEDFKRLHYLNIISLSEQMAKIAAIDLKEKLKQTIILGYKKIYIATHFPPFPEACIGKHGEVDYNWLPLSCSAIMGNMLSEIAENNTEIEFIVCAGHIHTKSEYNHFNNLKVLVGKGPYENEYGNIFISNEFEL